MKFETLEMIIVVELLNIIVSSSLILEQVDSSALAAAYVLILSFICFFAWLYIHSLKLGGENETKN